MNYILKDTKTNETTYFDGSGGLINCPYHDHDDTDPSCFVTLLDGDPSKKGIFNCKGASCMRSGIVVTDQQEADFQQRISPSKSNSKADLTGWDDDIFATPTKIEPIAEPQKPSPKKDIDYNNLVREHIYKDINGNNIKKKSVYNYKDGKGKATPQFRWEDNKWIGGLTKNDKTKVQEILYNSHLFTDLTKKIIITEGEKDADSVTSNTMIGTTLGSASNIIDGTHKKYFVAREKIGIVGDKDEAGAKFIYETIKALINMGYPINKINFLNFENKEDKKGYDISDAIRDGVKIKPSPISGDELKEELKKYEIFIEDIISPNHLLTQHQKMPRGIFNDDVEKMLEKVALASATTYDNVVHTFLPIISYLVCDKYKFVNVSFKTYLTLHSILIAESGDGKSNAMDFLSYKIAEMNREKKVEYTIAKEEYDKKVDEKKNKSKRTSYSSNKCDDNKKLVEPCLSFAQMTNMTIPSLKKQFKTDKKLMYLKDEVASLINGLNMHNKGGNDDDELLSIMDCKDIYQVRMGNDNSEEKYTCIERPMMPIYGNLQWSRVQVIKDKKESGFAYRFLFATCDQDEDYYCLDASEQHIVTEAKGEFSELFDNVNSLVPNVDSIRGGGTVDWGEIEESMDYDCHIDDGMRYLFLTNEANVIFRSFIIDHFNYLKSEFKKDGINIKPLTAKMRSHFSKLIAIIHIVNNNNNNDIVNGEIQSETVEKAVALSKFYLCQGYRVFINNDVSENKNEDGNFIKIKNFMIKREITEVTLNTLNRYVFQKLDKNSILLILEGLQHNGYLKMSTKGKSIKIKLI
jgi:hypothetical protein